MTTKANTHKLLDELAKQRILAARESIIRPAPDGGYEKLASTGVGDSEKDGEGAEVGESLAFSGSKYGKAYLETKPLVAAGFQGVLKTMFAQMDKGEDEKEMLAKYKFGDKKPVIAKLKEMGFDV